MTTPKADPHARITGKIVEQLEQSVRPWIKPWSADYLDGRVTRPLRATGEAYRGINTVLLWMEASASSYVCPTWLTYRQAQAMGGQVRRGEHGTQVVYYGEATGKPEGHGQGEEAASFRFLKTYTVFNVGQVDGLPDRMTLAGALASPPLTAPERIQRAESFLEATGAQVTHGGTMAFYRPSEDRIQLPPFETFRDAESYYATRSHETVHWTRHPTRLDRDFGQKRFGDTGYAREELVAELGSAFLAADLGLYVEPREDHASYLAHWVAILKEDTRAIFGAASAAERAVQYLHARQGASGSLL